MQLIDDSIDFAKYLAEPTDETRIRPAHEWCDAVVDAFYGDHVHASPTMGFATLDNRVQFRAGEVSLWGGYNGHWKTFVTTQVIFNMLRFGEKAMIASLEMKPHKTMQRMVRQAFGGAEPSIQYIKDLHKWTDGKLWLYDQQGTVKPDVMLGVLRYSADAIGCSQLVVDSLLKCGLREDDYSGQKEFVDRLCVFARDYNVHVHLIAHMRKGETEEAPPGKFDVRGATAISDLVDNVFSIWRNKRKERANAGQNINDRMKYANDGDAILSCVKQRHGDWEGAVALWADPESMQFRDRQEANPKRASFENV